MATTTNYSWTTPDDTALVKDGASAIRTLGSSIDTTTKNLNPSTTLGDIEYRSSTANTNTRLAIGTNGQVLVVSGGVPAWGTASPTYTAWTPTFTNITTGNGTKSGSYVQNGKFVSGYAKIVFGSTTLITGTPILTLPSTPENGNISFTSIIADTGTATFNGFGEMSGADFYCYVNNASGTYVNTSNISATVPMTWTTNDSLTISFNYKEV